MALKSPEILSRPTVWPGVNRRLLTGGGAPIQPIKRLEVFSEDEFERFVLEWANEYLSSQYVSVEQRGGAGDKGRDVIGWLDPAGVKKRRWVNYQCKHYSNPLQPNQFWIELGKLCHYTFTKEIPFAPEEFVIVTNKQIGPSLADLLNDPGELRRQLINKWGTHCAKQITARREVKLEGKLLDHVATFDFGIVKAKPPMELINEHSKTRYHSIVFGIPLKARKPPQAPPSVMGPHETIYVRQIFDAFGDHLKTVINEESEFASYQYLRSAFSHARECFYCVETLREFARDSFPSENYYSDVLDQFEEGLQPVFYDIHDDGYRRMVAAVKLASSLVIGANGLSDELRPSDRTGICHHLANLERVFWINRDE